MSSKFEVSGWTEPFDGPGEQVELYSGKSLLRALWVGLWARWRYGYVRLNAENTRCPM